MSNVVQDNDRSEYEHDLKSEFIGDHLKPTKKEISRNSHVQSLFNFNKVSNNPLTILDLGTWSMEVIKSESENSFAI